MAFQWPWPSLYGLGTRCRHRNLRRRRRHHHCRHMIFANIVWGVYYDVETNERRFIFLFLWKSWGQWCDLVTHTLKHIHTCILSLLNTDSHTMYIHKYSAWFYVCRYQKGQRFFFFWVVCVGCYPCSIEHIVLYLHVFQILLAFCFAFSIDVSRVFHFSNDWFLFWLFSLKFC